MSQHTKEPWITAGNGAQITSAATADLRQNWCIDTMDAGRHYDGDIALANARRIVACVNACAGVPNHILEAGNTISSARYANELAAQRDEMLATLSSISDFAVGNGDVCEIIARRAREAIAKAERVDGEA